MNQARLARVLRNMERDGLTQIVISSTASVYYLTGYWVEPMERMLALYIRADGTCRLFANALFALEPQEGLELVLHQDSDEPTAALAAALLPGTLGVDKAWPSKFLIALLAARPDVTPVLGSAPVDDARKYKDADEISAMRRASQINDQVVEAASSLSTAPARGSWSASAPTEPTPTTPPTGRCSGTGTAWSWTFSSPSGATGAT